MSNELFKNILQEMCDEEFAEYEASEEHKFSLSHRRKMKKLFREYEKNAPRTYLRKQRLILANVLPLL